MTKHLQKPDSKVFYVSSDEQLETAINQLSSYEGALAVDTERAGSFRYDDRAYLIQLKKPQGPIYLIDPVEMTDDAMDELAYYMNNQEWILHAATQDLPCLIELGMRPDTLFDTELAAQLLKLPKVGLAALCKSLLNIELAKEYSNVDWSARPLKTSWLIYAALDVELLNPLKEVLTEKLREEGKWDYALEEFDALKNFVPPAPPVEPWRKMHGLGNLRTSRELAIARTIWGVRDKIAKSRDVAPFTLLKDRQIVTLAQEKPRSVPQVSELLHWPASKDKQAARWLGAIKQGLRAKDLPAVRVKGSGMPSPSLWKERKEIQYRRYKTAQLRLLARAEELNMPVANVLPPAILKKVFWKSSKSTDIVAALKELGARDWQIEQTSKILEDALHSPMTIADIEAATS
ncbi:MAG: HRDC domain-containing protein [Micrococcaceae bacterium]